MKYTAVFAVVAVLTLIPLAWFTTGWVFVSLFEITADREITSEFFSLPHFLAGLGFALVGWLFALAGRDS